VAGSESLSPAAGKTTLRLGWTSDPDNLNPFIGCPSSSYEIWALDYELLVGFRASDFANEDKAPGGTTRSPIRTWRCIRAPRS